MGKIWDDYLVGTGSTEQFFVLLSQKAQPTKRLCRDNTSYSSRHK